MTLLPSVLLVVALALALVDEIRARGESLTSWAVVFIAVVLLWHRL